MENRFEHFTLDIFNISKYWNKIASEEMKEYGLRGAHALYLLILDGYEGEMTAARLADLCQRDKADVSRAIADFQKKGILEPYDGPRYRGQGITDEMRENMYHCLDLIATNMRLICEDGLMEQTDR